MRSDLSIVTVTAIIMDSRFAGKVVRVILGVAYAAWAIVQVYYAYLGLAPTVTTANSLKMFVEGSTFNVLEISWVATLIEGLTLGASAFNLLGINDYNQQKHNWFRWARWAVVDALLIAVIALVLGIVETGVLLLLAVIVVGLNFSQAANETEHADFETYTDLDNKKKYKTWWIVLDAWLVGLLTNVVLSVVFIYRFDAISKSLSPALPQWYVYVLMLIYPVWYTLLHLFIVIVAKVDEVAMGVSADARTIVLEIWRVVFVGLITAAAFDAGT